MNQELMKEFKADLKEFREMTEKFYAKEVSVKDYKGFSGGFGSYAQKGGEASMLRLRMPGGRVTKEKLKFLVDSIERYDVKRAHITTCQTVQFHDLDAKAVPKKYYGLSPLWGGTGGIFRCTSLCGRSGRLSDGNHQDGEASKKVKSRIF